jgi:hypothetical protein
MEGMEWLNETGMLGSSARVERAREGECGICGGLRGCVSLLLGFEDLGTSADYIVQNRTKKNHLTRATRALKMQRRRSPRKRKKRRKSWRIPRRSSRRVSAHISQLFG